MREIKFRVWDPNTSRMHLNIGIDKIYLYDFQGDNITEQDGLEIMQYTGLNDSNGKEIYEGDIVIHGTEHQYTEVINFEDGCFGTKDFHMDDVIPCEIIGNIYETPVFLHEP